ncbi:MAG: hypothetical protein ACHQFZ_01390 [Acidimicrobiales bacterium]
MRILRYGAVAALVVAAGLAAGAARSTNAAAPVPASCTPGALGQAFTGPLHLVSVDGWGCEGAFAYTWATVGTAPNEIGVTEVLRFDAAARQWRIVSRLTYCKPGALPEVVYRLGCFSN